MSITSKAQELQLDVDNALASLDEVDRFLYREWASSNMGTIRELHIHGMRVSLSDARKRLRAHATGTE